MIPIEKITGLLLQKRFGLLPEKLKSALSSEANLRIVAEVCKNHHIVDDEKIAIVQQVIAITLFGFVHTHDVGKEINDALALNNVKLTDSIAEELDAKIFNPIKTELESNYEPLEKETAYGLSLVEKSSQPVDEEEAPKIFREEADVPGAGTVPVRPQPTSTGTVEASRPTPPPPPRANPSIPTPANPQAERASPPKMVSTSGEFINPPPPGIAVKSFGEQGKQFEPGWSRNQNQARPADATPARPMPQTLPASEPPEDNDPPPAIIHAEPQTPPSPRASGFSFSAGAPKLSDIHVLARNIAPRAAVLEFGPSTKLGTDPSTKMGTSALAKPGAILQKPEPQKIKTATPPSAQKPLADISKIPREVHYSDMRTSLPTPAPKPVLSAAPIKPPTPTG